MKTTKRLLATLLTVIMLFGVVAVVANAASIKTTTSDYGYMVTTDAKISKAVTTVKVYGNYDYINFFISSNYDDMYFFYEIYSDKKMTKLVTADFTYCPDSGTYSWSPMITLKGVLATGTFYGVTYAARIDDSGNVTLSEKSLQEFKLSVNRSPKFNQKMVPLKSVTITANGPVIKWHKLSTDAVKYVIYRRSMSGTKWTKVGTVNGSTLSFTDKTTKDKNGKYIYTVKALNKSGTASRYLYNGLSCLYARTPKVSSVATTSDNRIQVKWNNTSGSAKYRVYRSENGGGWKLIANNVKGTSYYDTTAKSNGKNYKYTVRAVIPTTNGDAISHYVDTKKSVDFVVQPTLNPVSVVDNGLKITWGKVTGANAYTVYRKTLENGASWVSLGKVSKDVSEFIDTTANAESGFIYTVRSEGKTSRGCYSGEGVAYFTLSQPEFTTEEKDNAIYLKWNPVKYAEGYYVLKKDDNGKWTVYETVTKGNECVINIWQPHQELQLTVQAFRGETVSAFEEDVEKIDFWSATHFEYSVYTDKIVFKDNGGYSNTVYKLYRKLATQPDEAFELVTEGSGGSYGTVITDESNIEYDTEYIYQVKMCYKDVEQYKKIQTIKLIKYNPENYITGFDVVAKKRGEFDFGSIYFEEYLFDFIKSKNNLSESFNEKVYVKKGNNWNELESAESWTFDSQNYDLNNLNFSCVVFDEKGSTPIDSVVVNKSNPEFCEFVYPKAEVNADGLHIKWNDLEDVVEYKVEIYSGLNNPVLYESTIIDNDSKEYNVFVELAKCMNKGLFLRVTATSKTGNRTEYNAWSITVLEPPVLVEAKSNSAGKIQLKFTHPKFKAYSYVGESTFVIFRKAEGATKWENLGCMWPEELDNGKGVFIFTDTNVKSGVKYTYTVRIKNSSFGGYSSYYDTKGISVTAK